MIEKQIIMSNTQISHKDNEYEWYNEEIYNPIMVQDSKML